MAIPNDRRIGRTRRKLAAMLEATFPGLKIDPFDLTPQIPVYASNNWGCCSWDANVPMEGSGTWHIFSWDRMGALVKHGFDYSKEGREIELHIKQS